ncbi:hypothetical protein NS234_08955 [Microbacterium oxydans]|nr:hypothetical protein NS234_08955 [Microbacterium oxydans]
MSKAVPVVMAVPARSARPPAATSRPASVMTPATTPRGAEGAARTTETAASALMHSPLLPRRGRGGSPTLRRRDP